MAKVTLSDVSSLNGINSNFQRLEDELNNKALYRNNPDGEPNTMESSLDMNGERIMNLPPPVDLNEPVRLQDIADIGAEGAGAFILRTDLANATDTNKGDSLVAVKQLLPSSIARTQHQKNSEVVSVYDFGAIGDGLLHPLSERYSTLALAQAVYPFVTSLNQSIDWAAFQASVNSSVSEVTVPSGVFLITDTIAVSSTIRIKGVGGRVKASTSLISDVFSFTAINCSIIDIEIDGSDVSRCGVKYSNGGMRVQRCYLHNFKSTTTSAVAVEGNTHLGSSILDNIIEFVDAPSNGVIGDSIGASRAIEVHSTLEAVAGTLISGNRINHIVGEEGDAIQILFFDGVTFPFLSAKTTVSNNTINDYSRRGIKVQGSDVIVSGNHLTALTTYTNPSFSINIISSRDVDVIGNIVKSAMSCFSSSGSVSSSYNFNVLAIGNHFTVTVNTVANSFHDFNESLVVRNNVFVNGSSGFAAQNINRSEVSNNVFMGGPAGTGQSIQLFGGTTGFNVIANNSNHGTWTRCVNFTGINNIIKDNFSRTEGIRTTTGNTDALISGNVSGSGVAIFGDSTGQVLFNNQRLSGGVNGNTGEGINRVFNSSADPASINPTKNYSRGDFAFNGAGAAGNKVLGWKCVTSGAPAVFEAVTSV